MTKIQNSSEFIAINIALLTISDTRTIENDKSGNLLQERIISIGHNLKKRNLIKDDFEIIKQTFINLSKEPLIDAIISTGGTGLTGRDSTPEVVIELSDKMIDGFGELFRQISYNKIGTSTIQSRAIGAVINSTYVFCLPGYPSACKDGWDGILKYQLDIRHRPCNFIEIIPRLNEK